MSATRAGKSDRQWAGLLASIAGHVVLLLVVIFGGISFETRQPASELGMKARVVDPGGLARPEPPSPRPIPDPQPPADTVRDDARRAEARQREAEQQRAEAEKATRAAEAEKTRREAEKQAQAERVREQARVAEKKAADEVARKAAAEKAAADKAAKAAAEKKAAEMRAAEKKAAEQKAAEARAEAARKAEEQRQRDAQSDLARQLQEEEGLHAAADSGALAEYQALIRQKVERNWARPPSARPGLECEVLVTQIPGGEVAGVRMGSCNGDDAVRRSIEVAVMRASPLPLPDNPALFERNLRFTFKPEE